MIVNKFDDEVKKRENSLNIIYNKVKKHGRDELYDLTGLSGGFLLSENDISLLETYVGSAIFESNLDSLALNHLSGEKMLPFNRTSSGILATFLALVEKGSSVVHFLAKSPAHPSITRSANLVGANYLEFTDFNEFHIPKDSSLVIITGSTMDHQVLDEGIFKKVIDLAHDNDLPVFVDDASGARLRTVIFNQKKAFDLGADIVITSTDKLMPGPRGGLMTGKKELIDKIKLKSLEFGLEAQAPLIAGMVRGLENFNEDNLINSLKNKKILLEMLNNHFNYFEETATGVMLSEESLEKEFKSKHISHKLPISDLCFLFSIILLKEGLITIPAVSMPGASRAIRFDLSSYDASKITLENLKNKIVDSFDRLIKLSNNESESSKLILGKY